MTRQQAMRAQKKSRADIGESRADLGDSWVVEKEENFSSEQDSDYSSSSQEPTPTTKTQTRSKLAASGRRAAVSSSMASSEPILIMPSIHEEVKGSRGDFTKRRTSVQPSPKRHKTPRRAPAARVSHAVPEQPTSIFDGMDEILWSILNFILGIIGRTFRLLEGPIILIIAGCVLYAFIWFGGNILKSSIYTAMSPICAIPGSSFLLSICERDTTIDYRASKEVPVHFDQLMDVQSRFEGILEQTAAGIELPLDMKRSEASIRDLSSQVRYSSLKSKMELVNEFDNFVATARLASRDLQVFNSHVGRSVDIVLALAKWTQRTLHGIEADIPARGTLRRLFFPLRATETQLRTQYLEHASAIETEIHRLVLEAQALLQILQSLDDRLDVIASLTARDTHAAQVSQQEVLAQLWSLLGGNGAQIARFNRELTILRKVATYRQNAFGYVAGTILQLQAMEAELEGLRERVVGPGTAPNIPLRVHIENIQLGVERLEGGRETFKRKEGEVMTQRLGENRQGDQIPKLLPPSKDYDMRL